MNRVIFLLSFFSFLRVYFPAEFVQKGLDAFFKHSIIFFNKTANELRIMKAFLLIFVLHFQILFFDNLRFPIHSSDQPIKGFFRLLIQFGLVSCSLTLFRIILVGKLIFFGVFLIAQEILNILREIILQKFNGERGDLVTIVVNGIMRLMHGWFLGSILEEI